jgi:hypothetical protein
MKYTCTGYDVLKQNEVTGRATDANDVYRKVVEPDVSLRQEEPHVGAGATGHSFGLLSSLARRAVVNMPLCICFATGGAFGGQTAETFRGAGVALLNAKEWSCENIRKIQGVNVPRLTIPKPKIFGLMPRCVAAGITRSSIELDNRAPAPHRPKQQSRMRTSIHTVSPRRRQQPPTRRVPVKG